MRYLILSDIHANWEALLAVLKSAGSGYEQIVCCGDLVGYGADPDAVVRWVRENVNGVVRGNHDKACAGLEDLEWFNPVARLSALWTQAVIQPEHAEYLRALAQGPERINGVFRLDQESEHAAKDRHSRSPDLVAVATDTVDIFPEPHRTAARRRRRERMFVARACTLQHGEQRFPIGVNVAEGGNSAGQGTRVARPDERDADGRILLGMSPLVQRVVA